MSQSAANAGEANPATRAATIGNRFIVVFLSMDNRGARDDEVQTSRATLI